MQFFLFLLYKWPSIFITIICTYVFQLPFSFPLNYNIKELEKKLDSSPCFLLFFSKKLISPSFSQMIINESKIRMSTVKTHNIHINMDKI